MDLLFNRKTIVFNNPEISDYQLNYNCSLVFNEANNEYYLISRSQNSLTKPSILTLTILTPDFKIIKSFPLSIPNIGVSTEDPSAVIKDNTLFIFVNNGGPRNFKKVTKEDFKIWMVEIELISGDFTITNYMKLIYNHSGAVEKNWCPFWSLALQKWLVIYSVNPWIVLEIDKQWNCHKILEQQYELPWHYGQIRGGATPVRVLPPDGVFSRSLPCSQFYSFFHSSFQEKGFQRYYVGGLITFNDDLKPTGISRVPLFYPEPTQKSSVQAKVCFPRGAVKQGNQWHVSMGQGDKQCRIDTISHDEIIHQRNFLKLTF